MSTKAKKVRIEGKGQMKKSAVWKNRLSETIIKRGMFLYMGSFQGEL